ncbi:SapC family protein [Halomonas sp. TBZ9]|uniref:SapC family protein n=1 Tax=Vreelandella azerica TaxID=2732867 RepID=A0A7Y3U063_9GAMM|nr:SapC family protein [Halomonas azerica]NOG32677.1 SapC family protein [Halomonas azerica]
MLSDASLVPLSWSAHGGLMWQRFTSYDFAAEVHWVPLAEQELAQAALAFPIAFRFEEGTWSVVALLGLVPGRNVWVDGNDGRWCQRYVPAALRSQPFGVHREDPDTLCVDESSEWLVQSYEGEPLFDDERGLASFVQKTHEFLKAWANGSEKLSQLASVLDDYGVLTSWESPVLKELPELYHIDEARWNALDDEAAARVRRQGALPLIYARTCWPEPTSPFFRRVTSSRVNLPCLFPPRPHVSSVSKPFWKAGAMRWPKNPHLMNGHFQAAKCTICRSDDFNRKE